MANHNRVTLIGRLTRDPEMILTDKGVKFGFAVNNRRYNQQKQQWEDDPCFLDCEMWNRSEGAKQATRLFETVKKGGQLFLDGNLRMDSWEDRNGGGKRTKIVVVVHNFQYLDAPPGGGGNGNGRHSAPPPDTGSDYDDPNKIPF